MKEQIEKQAIEEMAKVIERTEQIARDAHCGLPSPTMYAKDLYWHGYRKQSEGEKSKGCEYCKGRAYTKKPLTVITKYGRRIELVFEFCPNCGRKMKGGAE